MKDNINSAWIMKRIINCIVSILCLVICFVVVTQGISIFSFHIGHKIYPLFEKIDPDNVFIVYIIHHIIQAIISIILIVICSKVLRIDFRRFGFNFNHFKYNLKAISVFLLIWFFIQAGVGIFFITVYDVSTDFSFPLNIYNFTGYYLFEILLSGTSEEIMFRSLVITVMAYVLRKKFDSDKHLFTVVIVASTVVFMIGHVNFTLSPFRITYFNILQQLTCLVAGLFYGFLFVKTKSIVGSMLAHNFLNGVINLVGLLLVMNL